MITENIHQKVLEPSNSFKGRKSDHPWKSKSLANFEAWKVRQGLDSDTKVFIIDWNYPDVAESLKSRGWYQNPDPDSINFNLKYSRKARIPKNINDWQILNHFPRNYELSAKWNLCDTIKKNENITGINHLNYFPRCFKMEYDGLSDFCNTYKLIFCLGVLKRFIQNINTPPISKVILCNNICKKWASEVKAKGIGKNLYNFISESEWREIYELNNSNPETISAENLIDSITKTLNSLKKLDPQYELSGFRNIWIIKPGRKSRGRDIKILTNLEDIKEYTNAPNYWVAQKYIENPLLIHSKKFDIRQWVLISSFDPLTVWVYKKCYLRFTAEEFSFEDLSNDFMHLTNNSISKNSAGFGGLAGGEFMWHLDEFREFLINTQGRDVWTESLYPDIKQVVINSILTAGKLNRKNSFELLGFDLMVDESLKPWLIEINTSPAMDYSTVTHK